MATLDDDRIGAAPWLLSGPALLLFVGCCWCRCCSR
jgi:putative spermidine/putrescine transport system permease protein